MRGLRAVGERVEDLPHRADGFLGVHLEVGDRGAEHRVPVHQALAAVDQAFFIQSDTNTSTTARDIFASIVKYFAVVPVAVEAPRRRIWRVMVEPDSCFHSQTRFDEGLAAEVVARLALVLELALDHDLRGDAGVVGADHPVGVEAAHAVVARSSASISVCWNAWPMCSVPVTFGGGSWMQ